MKIKLLINQAPISINKHYYYPVLKHEIAQYNKGIKTRIYGKPVRSADARNWASLVFTELQKAYNADQLSKMRAHFNENVHTLGIRIETYSNTLYTKAGKVSSRSLDCSNIEKPIIDLIFDSKYFERAYPDGCKNLNINDKYITELSSSKHYTHEDPFMFITIYTKELPSAKNKVQED